MEHTYNKEVVITVTQIKWEKTRIIVLELKILMREERVPHKILEGIRGFLIYVARTFKWMTPYLKGLHLHIYVWREERDKDLYKTKSQPRVFLKLWEWEHENWLVERELEVLRMNMDETAPEWLDPPPRLREDVLTLKRITAPEKPAATRRRSSESINASDKIEK